MKTLSKPLFLKTTLFLSAFLLPLAWIALAASPPPEKGWEFIGKSFEGSTSLYLQTSTRITCTEDRPCLGPDKARPQDKEILEGKYVWIKAVDAKSSTKNRYLANCRAQRLYKDGLEAPIAPDSLEVVIYTRLCRK